VFWGKKKQAANKTKAMQKTRVNYTFGYLCINTLAVRGATEAGPQEYTVWAIGQGCC